MFKRSQALNKVAEALYEADECCFEDADTMTTGYDNDGSTGVDMVENGITIGLEMAATGGGAWLVKHPRKDHCGIIVVAKDEAEAEAKLRLS